MTQDTGECPYRRLYIDISAWITNAKILSVFERTGHHGQYGGHKGSLLISLATSVVTAASILSECAIYSHDECWQCLHLTNILLLGHEELRSQDTHSGGVGGSGTLIKCYHRQCVCVCFLPIHSGHQVRWTYQPGSHRRKVTQDF